LCEGCGSISVQACSVCYCAIRHSSTHCTHAHESSWYAATPFTQYMFIEYRFYNQLDAQFSLFNKSILSCSSRGYYCWIKKIVHQVGCKISTLYHDARSKIRQNICSCLKLFYEWFYLGTWVLPEDDMWYVETWRSYESMKVFWCQWLKPILNNKWYN
jgi:hypothetical protein